MAIYDDFVITYAEKRIRHVSGQTTIYSVNALYSWLMDDFDAQAQMDDTVPMSAQTPTDYTFINQWFMDEVSLQFLKTGAIKTDGWNGQIRLLKMKSAGYTPAIDTDIGKTVTGGGSTHTGTLLYYDNTKRYWWVRSAQAFQDNETCTISPGGTGVGDINTRASGEEIYSNIYTLGTIEAGTDAYVYQAGLKIAAWWAAGHIDILVRVKEMGTTIDSGILWVSMRVWTKTDDHSSVDVSAGGRTPVPFATAVDLNNQTAVGTVANYDDIQVAFVNGTIPYGTGSGTAPAAGNVAIDVTSKATGIILSSGTAASGTLTLGNVEGTFGNGNAVEEADYLDFDNQVGAFAVGDVVTTDGGWSATIRRLVQTFSNNGTAGRMYVDTVSGSVADNDPLKVGGSEKALAKGALVTTTWAASLTGTLSSTATISKDLNNGNGAQPYNVVIRCANRSIASVYEFLKYVCVRTSDWQTYRVETGVIVKYNGERYDMALLAYTPVKASPLGTFAGGKFFGARGIWVEGMLSTDAQNFQLTDANGVTQTPPNYQDVKVTSLVAGDQVAVFLLTGSGGSISKDMCGGCAATSQGVDYLNVAGPIPEDLPSAGSVRVIEMTSGVETLYTYAGIDFVANKFTGLSPVTAYAYDTADDLYVPYIDKTAGSDTELATIKIVAVRYVLIRVRKKGIIPFEAPNSITATGMTQAAIRTPDAIVQ